MLEPYIQKYDIPRYNKVLEGVAVRANNGNNFAIYLLGYFKHKIHGRDGRNQTKEREGSDLVLEMAKEGVISAIAMKGFWYHFGYQGLNKNQKKSVELLQATADIGHPMAMAWLGSFYHKGEAGLPMDRDKARKLLEVVADYGHPYAIKELGKLNSGSSSSGCYITTAACSSFKKSDDCYELNMFRRFRDNWLIQ